MFVSFIFQYALKLLTRILFRINIINEELTTQIANDITVNDKLMLGRHRYTLQRAFPVYVIFKYYNSHYPRIAQNLK